MAAHLFLRLVKAGHDDLTYSVVEAVVERGMKEGRGDVTHVSLVAVSSAACISNKQARDFLADFECAYY